MQSAEIRSRWLKFFESENKQGLKHTVVPSASLIADDPNLLLVNAGMVPFKPYFLGEVTPPYKRATSVQKCVRTLDIDEVGKTTRHASFFQMCGNFSFGDYFKEGAIALAWELLTRPIADGGYGFPEDRLWVTVYLDDDEAADIWHKKIGIPITFDFLHNKCNPSLHSEEEALRLCLSTWPKEIPAITHYSASKRDYEDPSAKDVAHSDWLYEKIETYDLVFDIELEVKMKEKALLEYNNKIEKVLA